MPYVAMAELKWSIPGRKGSVMVNAGDEVCPPVPARAIQRGVVAFLPNVTGMMWDERMVQVNAAQKVAEAAAEKAKAEAVAEAAKTAPVPEPEPVIPPGHYAKVNGKIRKIPDGHYLKNGKPVPIPPGFVVHGDTLIKEPRRPRQEGEPRPGGPRAADLPPPVEEVDPSEAAALGLLPDDAPEPQETAEGDKAKPGLLGRKTEVAGPGAEGQVPAGPEAPAPASDDKASKSKGRGSRRGK